jgi:hypothetical protein
MSKVAKIGFMVMVLSVLGLFSARAAVKPVVQFRPIALMQSDGIYDIMVDHYTTESRWWGSYTYWDEGETSDTDVGYLPNIAAGARIDLGDKLYTELTGVGGLLTSEYIDSSMFGFDAALRFKFGKNGKFAVGPHVGLVRLSPEWSGSAKVEFSSTTGSIAGLGFAIDFGDMLGLLLQVDYLSAKSDVTTSGGWRSNIKEIDFSGPMLQLGLNFKF